MAARESPKLIHGNLCTKGLTVGPILGHRIERIAHRNDPCFQKDLVPFQPMRVTAPIEPFMMLLNNRRNLPVVGLLDHFCPICRMLLNHFILLTGQSAWLIQNFFRNMNLANVMQNGGDRQILQLFFIKLQLLGNLHGVLSDPITMHISVAVLLLHFLHHVHQLGNILTQVDKRLLSYDPKVSDIGQSGEMNGVFQSFCRVIIMRSKFNLLVV
ncbi:hypothetical protein D3C72_723060 [compost metagenome]